MKKLFFIFSIIIVLAACTHKTDKRFSAIAGTISSEPLSALDSLEKINVKELSRADRHYYNFLTVKAKDKAYITHTSDSLILDVIDYYKGDKDKALYSEALYYGGRVYSDLGDYPTALNYFHQALDKLPESSKGTNLESRIVSQTGRLLNTLRLYDEAIPYVKRLIEIDSISNDTINWVYNLQLLGGIYLRDGNFTLAEKFLNKSLRLSTKLHPFITENSKLYLADVKARTGNIDSALILIRDVLNNPNPININTALAFSSDIYLKAGLYDSAYIFSQKILMLPEPIQKRTAYRILLSPELSHIIPKDSNVYYVQRYKDILEKDFNENESQLTIERQNIYNYKIHKIRRLESEKFSRKIFILAVSISFISLIILVVAFYLKYLNKKTLLRLHKSISEISSLRISLKEKEEIIRNSENDLRELKQFDSPYKDTSKDLKIVLRNELRALYEMNPKGNVSLKILESDPYKVLNSYIENNISLREDELIWDKVEKIILDDSPDFFKRINILLEGRLSKTERHTLLLVRIGFSPSQISMLLSRARNTISTRRESIGRKLFGEKIDSKMVDGIIRLL